MSIKSFRLTFLIPLFINTFSLRLISFGLVVVLRSEKDGVAVGDHMFGMTPWEAYTVQPYIEGSYILKFYSDFLKTGLLLIIEL